MQQKITIDSSTIRLRLSLLKQLIKAGKGYQMGDIVWRDKSGGEHLSLRVRFYKEYNGGNNTGYVLGLRWRTPYGEQGEQDICLVPKESNLGRGRVWYFVCNYTENLCRTLYFVRDSTGGFFYSRYALPFIYEHQQLSRLQRTERFLYEDIPSLRGRKYTYRGKLTPFAKKYERLSEKAMEAERVVYGRLFKKYK